MRRESVDVGVVSYGVVCNLLTELQMALRPVDNFANR